MSTALGTQLEYSVQIQNRQSNAIECSGRIESGNLPIISAPVLLQRGERCHFTAPAIVQKEIRTVTKRINDRGTTASIPIMTNVRWLVGSITSQRITQDVLAVIDSGGMFLTTKRILINGVRKNIATAYENHWVHGLHRRHSPAEGDWERRVYSWRCRLGISRRVPRRRRAPGARMNLRLVKPRDPRKLPEFTLWRMKDRPIGTVGGAFVAD
jgi:hypothetical protein